jgi:hypothetical protein
MAGRDDGAALLEAAIVLPVLLMLLISAMMFGLASVDDIRLERATSDAARLSETEARQVVSSVHGTIVCWWQGIDQGGCFDDGLVIARTQVIAEGSTWEYPTGSFQPVAHVSRPTETTTTTTEGETS